MSRPNLAICIFVIGLLVTSYLCWCLDRSSLNAFAPGWPRPWPYPDGWLAWWEKQMDLAHPPPPGFFKMDGEWQRQWIYLYCAIGGSLIFSLSSLGWWFMLMKRRDDIDK